MAKLTANQQAYALISHFESLYVKKYDRKPTLNRNRIKWAFQDMVTDLGYDDAKSIIDFYFTTNRVLHPVEYLLYNYDKLSKIRQELEDDEAERDRIRQRTKKAVEEWMAKNGSN